MSSHGCSQSHVPPSLHILIGLVSEVLETALGPLGGLGTTICTSLRPQSHQQQRMSTSRCTSSLTWPAIQAWLLPEAQQPSLQQNPKIHQSPWARSTMLICYHGMIQENFAPLMPLLLPSPINVHYPLVRVQIEVTPSTSLQYPNFRQRKINQPQASRTATTGETGVGNTTWRPTAMQAIQPFCLEN